MEPIAILARPATADYPPVSLETAAWLYCGMFAAEPRITDGMDPAPAAMFRALARTAGCRLLELLTEIRNEYARRKDNGT